MHASCPFMPSHTSPRHAHQFVSSGREEQEATSYLTYGSRMVPHRRQDTCTPSSPPLSSLSPLLMSHLVQCADLVAQPLGPPFLPPMKSLAILKQAYTTTQHDIKCARLSRHLSHTHTYTHTELSLYEHRGSPPTSLLDPRQNVSLTSIQQHNHAHTTHKLTFSPPFLPTHTTKQ